MKAPLVVLALSHEASRSGAPRVHLGWLRWAVARPDRFVVHSVLVRNGPLLQEWPATRSLKRLSWLEGRRTLTRWLSHRWIDRPFFLRRRFRRTWENMRDTGIDVILVNSQAAGWLLPALGADYPPVVLHSHELAGFARRFNRTCDLELMRKQVARWIVVSEAGRRYVVEEVGVPAARVQIVRNPALPLSAQRPTRLVLRERLAAEVGLPADVPWIIAVGGIDPVKAPDIFVDIASLVSGGIGGQVRFIWIGAGIDSPYGRTLRRRSGADQVIFVGARDDVDSWLLAADMVLLTSSEESSSLVVLEATSAGLPVLAFAGTGGSDEVLGSDSGCLVAERTAPAMAVAVRRWLAHPEEAMRAAAAVGERVRAEADYECQCEKIAGVLEAVAREYNK